MCKFSGRIPNEDFAAFCAMVDKKPRQAFAMLLEALKISRDQLKQAAQTACQRQVRALVHPIRFWIPCTRRGEYSPSILAFDALRASVPTWPTWPSTSPVRDPGRRPSPPCEGDDGFGGGCHRRGTRACARAISN